MATADFYRDEHPKPTEGGGWGGAGGGGAGGGWGGGGSWVSGGGSGGKPEININEVWYLVGSWFGDDDLILVDGEGTILTNGFELLLAGCCMKIEIECQLNAYGPSILFNHVDCILLGAVAKEGEVSGNAIFEGLLKNGEIDIYARWQKGHYDIGAVHSARFRLKDRNETITPWYRLNIEDAPGTRIMTLVVKDGIITTKNMG